MDGHFVNLTLSQFLFENIEKLFSNRCMNFGTLQQTKLIKNYKTKRNFKLKQN
jgi:hypothetical protein